MKTLRTLFVMSFMLVLFVGSAQAQGGGSEMGYVPLLTQVDPAIPLRIQAQDAYERFLPVLRAAQKSGSILEFQPEFVVGIVKIKFAAGARPARLGGLTVYDDLHTAISSVLHANRSDSEMRTLTYAPRFTVETYSCWAKAEGLGNGDRVVGSLRDQAGKLLAVYEAHADPTGKTFWGCFDGAYRHVLPGYKVTFKVYTSGGGLRGTYQTTAPNIKFTALNNVNSVASGKGPAGKPYEIYWDHDNLNAANTYLYIKKTGTISSSGAWSKDFGTTKFRGGDDIDISVNSSPRFWFERYMSVPFSYCYLGDNYCEMYGFPNQAASMTITHAGIPYTYTGKFELFSGGFWHSIEDSSGLPILLVAGDKFQGTGISAYNLPNLTATFNYTTDVVSGKAPANKYFWVDIWDPYGSHWYGLWAHSNASGNYSANFHASWDVKMSDPFIVEISYTNPVGGNRTYMYKAFGP